MKILHLEDNSNDAELVRELLAQEFPACVVSTVESEERFLAGLAPEDEPQLILSDFSLPGFDGLTALSLAQEHAPGVPFVFLSGSIGEERAIAAVRAGAYDYVLKNNIARLGVVIRRAVDEYARRRTKEHDERRLRELGGILERASEAIVVSDLTGRITLWNNGAVRLYGIPVDQAVGRMSSEIFSVAELEHVRAARQTTETGAEWQREVSIVTRDGRNLVVDLRMTLVRDAGGRPNALLSIAADITEKKKFEEQFLRAQRLEGLGMLAAGIAHDFNNVLAPMIMAAPLLRIRATHPGDLRMLDMLERNTARGAGLVRQILSFVRGVGGGLQLTQISHLLRDIGEVVGAGFPKSIAIEHLEQADLPTVMANPTQIHQVILNLAVNARDAMPRGGTLRIAAEVCVLDAEVATAMEGARPGQFVAVEVTDTGEGMSPEVLARIWEPFFTTKGQDKGTGLGLSTVRGIAAAHGGFVTVKSRVGSGSSFRVYFPVAEAGAAQPPAVAAVAEASGQGELIMVVDDEASLREVTAAILTGYGYRTLLCADGVEAVARFTEPGAAIDLVITDINMPNLDGAAMAVLLRRLQPDLKLIAVSGLSSDLSGSPSFADFNEKLSKPYTAAALRAAVRRVLRSGHADAA